MIDRGADKLIFDGVFSFVATKDPMNRSTVI